MAYVLIITGLVLVALGATLAIAYSLRKQRDAAMQEMAMIAQRLTDIERKLDREEVGKFQTSGKTRIQDDLNAMTDEELFQYITKVIREQELYRWPDFNRAGVMHHFSLSAVRVGAAFAQGGGQSLPEFVRNCRLDYACRLMVERPSMSFVEVGEASGFQRTTTFYHDFKARFGMAPAEYRKIKVISISTSALRMLRLTLQRCISHRWPLLTAYLQRLSAALDVPLLT